MPGLTKQTFENTHIYLHVGFPYGSFSAFICVHLRSSAANIGFVFRGGQLEKNIWPQMNADETQKTKGATIRQASVGRT